jgi:hypothetical protein
VTLEVGSVVADRFVIEAVAGRGRIRYALYRLMKTFGIAGGRDE